MASGDTPLSTNAAFQARTKAYGLRNYGIECR